MIAAAAGVSRSTVVKVLNRDPEARGADASRARIHEVAKKLGYDFSNLRRIHRRASPRIEVDLPVELEIRTRSRVYDRGRARLTTLNTAGLKIGRLELPKKTLPLEPFDLRIRVQIDGVGEVSLQCEPITLSHDGGLAIGAAFGSRSRNSAQRLWEMLADAEGGGT